MFQFRKSILLITTLMVSSVSFAFNFNQKSVNELARTYGYLYAQELSLNYINQNYPELSNDIFQAKTRFNLTFPNIKENVKNVFLSIDKSKTNEALTKGENLFNNQYEKFNNITRVDAINFINIVNERSKGNIENPVLETMLAVQYEKNPQKEIADGFYKRFSSVGLNKAKGIEVKLKIPKSWQEQEAERPNIVKKWVSQNGNGNSYIMLMVKNAEGVNPDLAEIEKLYRNGEIYEMVPEGFKITDKGSPIVLEGQNGFRYKMSGIVKRLDFNLYGTTEMYSIFYKDKFIAIQCMTGGLPSNKIEVDLEYQKVEPLCRSVANSLILPQKYRD